MKIGLGLDIGGTNTKLIVLNDKGRILFSDRFKTQSELGQKDFIDRLSLKVKQTIKIFPLIKKAAIGMAGDIDSENGILRFSPNLSGWKNFPVAGLLSKKTGISYKMENDANMAAWGAYVMELKRKSSAMAAITMGTGIGGGLVLDGKLYHGATSTAGEIGHMLVSPQGRLCGCGSLGCLEAYCGSRAIVRRAMTLIKNPKKYAEKYSVNNPVKINTVTLARAAKAKDLPALEIWREVGHYLSVGIGNIIMLLNPKDIVLTGGVSKGKSFFMPALKEGLKKFSIKTPIQEVKITVSDNADLGSFGCAFFAMEK